MTYKHFRLLCNLLLKPPSKFIGSLPYADRFIKATIKVHLKSTSQKPSESPLWISKEDFLMKELKVMTKQIEFAFAQAFFSYLFKQELITMDELTTIRQVVRKGNVFVDNKEN